MELQKDKKYNENLGKTSPTTISPKDGGMAFKKLTELDELKRQVRTAEMDIINGIGDKEILKSKILIWKKGIAELESKIIKESSNQSPVNPEKIIPEIRNKTNYICQHCFKIVDQVHRCPKCSLDLCLEHLSNHSCIKKYKVEEKHKKESSEYITASKTKKPWWKFW